MSYAKKKELPPLTDEQLRDDLKRAIIAVLLRRRTWESEDLQRTMTVQQVAEALVRPFTATVSGGLMKGEDA